MAKLVTRNDRPDDDLTWLQTIWSNPVQRVFWITEVPDKLNRGGHRHPTCHMALHCLTGSVKVYVQTPLTDQWYTLDTTMKYLLLDPEDWRMMYEFSEDSILVVLAEKPYELTQYVDDPYRLINENLLGHFITQ